jgi:hypothetical protein
MPTLGPVTILNHVFVCTCGCHGSDPWHRTWYKRVVTVATADALEGTVRMPYSSKPVRVTRDVVKHGLWVVDRNSIVFDK